MAKKRIGLDEVDEGAEHLINNTEVGCESIKGAKAK